MKIMSGRFLLSCVTLVTLLVISKSTAADPLEHGSTSFVTLPASDTHYQRVKEYIEELPQSDYHQASTAREAFRDMKLGVRISLGRLFDVGNGRVVAPARILQ